MKFNPDLIQKARNGEIAILNDGTKEELYELIRTISTIPNWSYYDNSKWLYLSQAHNNWQGLKICNMPAHSVKDFYMPDTKDKPIFRKENEGHQPRTYRVTRQQMKEIYDLLEEGQTSRFRDKVNHYFEMWNNEASLHEGVVSDIIGYFRPGKIPDLFRSIFPSYFFIPEGEPVLRRELEDMPWKIGVSDGKGGVYSMSGISGPSDPWKFIIPFTKNPPK